MFKSFAANSSALALLLSFSATVVGCDITNDSAGDLDARVRDSAPAKLELVDELPGDRDGYTLNDLKIDGTVLEASVSYGGGCKKHDFKLFWDRRVLETFPAQARLKLIHNGNGDGCEAFITRTVRFDLGPLAAAGAGEIILGVSGGGEPGKSVSFAPFAAKPLVVVESSELPAAGDGFALQDAVISGEELKVTVAYGGGCEKHDFTLYWDGVFLESFPPQVHLLLNHEGNGDACEAFLTEELTFDLGPLAGASQSNVIVHVNAPGSSKTVTFTP